MNIDVEVSEININVGRLLKKVNGNTLGREAAREWWRLYADWTPFREGNLYNDVQLRPWEIHHKAVYARYQYYGDGFRHFTGYHPRASSRWDRRAEPTQKPKLEQTLQRFVDGGGLHLGK